ncbi:CRISPR-associated endonuclease Cas4g/Cas1g [Prescottella subtropica]|uniref:CRISPR-associated endonuclease Cas4g/Cas1g n=1 Tax=Prescottella subtropica TaxID=2545757 RepID=UPI0019D5F3D9|nr:CRISPR-associated endonuclease Cas1 [Prescottella subtropica]
MVEQPDLLPARMLNEFVYCPRLFYLEWVDSRWADSEDTVQGDWTHRKVDRKAGVLPSPDDVEFLGRATSVRLESSRLGLVAVVDRIEGRGGTVVPVDVKKGRPGKDGRPWPADRIQVLAQSALLRDNGYLVDEAVLYYAETHQRVSVDVDDEALDEVRQVLDEARRVAAEPRPPLPLVGSRKCPKCSLVGLCLPDETNALLAREDGPARTILPRDPDTRPVYVTEAGAAVGIRGGRLRVTKDDRVLVETRLIDVSQLCVYGNVQVSSQALAELWSAGAPVLWFSYGGWLRGWAQGEMSKYVELRRRQLIVHAQGGFDVAKQLIVGKIKNSRTLLRRNARGDVAAEVAQLGALVKGAEQAESAASLLGIEGTAARIYFSRFSSMLSTSEAMAATFDENGRRRRPAPDPVNALLGFTYALLVKDIVATCLAVGLDPYLGVYHRPRYGRPALALDLMEEFRPLIADSVVINVLNNGEISESDFTRKGDAAWLTPNGRKSVLRAYERRMDTVVTHPVFKYKISYRRVLDVQARILAGVMIGEIDQYVPMTTR